MKIVFTLFIAFLLAGCVSSGEDYRIAREVNGYLAATKIVPTDFREADRTGKGRIVYFGPGTKGRPHFTYYAITSETEMATLEAAARKAVQEVEGANVITLHFMEKQVWKESSDGSKRRGREREIRKVVVRRQPAA